MKILITTKNGELLYQYDSFTESQVHDNALVTGLISAIVALSSEVVSSFPRELEFEGKILYFYNENEFIAALLTDIESPFNGDILPLLLAEFRQVQKKYNFSSFEAIKYQKEISYRIKGALAEYLSNIQRNMSSFFEKTDLNDYNSIIKLKNVARDLIFEGPKDFLSFDLISRLIPEGMDKILYALVVGIPLIVTGNRSIVEPMIQSFRLLSPTRVLKVKLWSFKYEPGYDIIGTNDFRHIIPSPNVIIVNVDEGVVFGGRSSDYFQDIAKQLKNLNAMEAFSLLRTELDWIFKALKSLSIRMHSKDSLPLEKQMILFELLKRLQS
ncbi:MAG: hypothetical protein ACTSSG_07265 [Candidatus Heimdallarchaeaceae archaeon]